MRMSTDLITDHKIMARDLHEQLAGSPQPVAIVLDTLNKSLVAL